MDGRTKAVESEIGKNLFWTDKPEEFEDAVMDISIYINGETTTYTVTKSTTIPNLRKMIADKIGTDLYITLFYKGRELRGDRNLYDYGVAPGDKINGLASSATDEAVESEIGDGMYVYIVDYGLGSFSRKFPVTMSTTIKQLKQEIAEKTEYREYRWEDYELYWGRTKLDDNKTMKDCGIDFPGIELFWTAKPEEFEDAVMDISIYINGETTTYTVTKSTTIENLKKMIADKIGTDQLFITLYYKDYVMRGDRTLDLYGVAPGDTIYVAVGSETDVDVAVGAESAVSQLPDMKNTNSNLLNLVIGFIFFSGFGFGVFVGNNYCQGKKYEYDNMLLKAEFSEL